MPGEANLPELLCAVREQATRQAMASLILRGDPQFSRISRDDRPRVIEAALRAGAAEAEAVRSRHGRETPAGIACHLGIPIIETPVDCSYGSLLRYAEYCTKPPVIRIYRRAILRLNRYLADPAACECLRIADATPVFVAHELYHHLDTFRVTARQEMHTRVSIARFGAFNWTSGLITFCEIAAGSFAQELLGLNFHPKLLDLIAFWDESPSRAQHFAEALREETLRVVP